MEPNINRCLLFFKWTQEAIQLAFPVLTSQSFPAPLQSQKKVFFHQYKYISSSSWKIIIESTSNIFLGSVL